MALQFKTQPYKHQRYALQRMRGQDSFALLMEVGTGKTKILIDDAARLYANKIIDTLLVFAPNGRHLGWPTEDMATHFPDGLDWIGVNYHGAGAGYESAAHKEQVRKVLSSPAAGPLRVISVGIDSMNRPGTAWKFVEQVIRNRKVAAVIDESHKIKRPAAKRSRKLWQIGSRCEVRRIATGSAVTKGLENLYSQYRFLDVDIIGARTNAEFKERYCQTVNNGFADTIVGYKNTDELFGRIAPVTFQVLKKDCLDLPEAVPVEVVVEMTAEQRKMYNELRKSLLLELPNGDVIDGEHTLSLMLRLRQIAAGHISATGSDNWHPIPNMRIQRVLELFEEAGDKMLVWCTFVPDILQLSAAFQDAGFSFAQYYGGNKSTREKELAYWRAVDRPAALFGTPSTGGVGLTMNESATTVNFTYSYDLEDWDQSHGRNHRIGQTRSVTYHTIVSAPIERRILNALKKKQDVAKLLSDRREAIQWLEEPA